MWQGRGWDEPFSAPRVVGRRAAGARPQHVLAVRHDDLGHLPASAGTSSAARHPSNTTQASLPALAAFACSLGARQPGELQQSTVAVIRIAALQRQKGGREEGGRGDRPEEQDAVGGGGVKGEACGLVEDELGHELEQRRGDGRHVRPRLRGGPAAPAAAAITAAAAAVAALGGSQSTQQNSAARSGGGSDTRRAAAPGVVRPNSTRRGEAGGPRAPRGT